MSRCIELCDMYFADGPTRCKCVEQDSDEDDNCIYYEVDNEEH